MGSFAAFVFVSGNNVLEVSNHMEQGGNILYIITLPFFSNRLAFAMWLFCSFRNWMWISCDELFCLSELYYWGPRYIMSLKSNRANENHHMPHLIQAFEPYETLKGK